MKQIRTFFLVLILFWTSCAQAVPPKLTVVMVIDQFAYSYLPKLRPFLRYGLKELFDTGILYTNAYHAHGVPETTPGHHAIGTGTLPKDHGAVYNQWFEEAYKKEHYADDHSPKGAMLNKSAPGQSPHKTQIEGLSDQYVKEAPQDTKHHVWALSLKSYPAIAMAQQRGKALWFDNVHGGFTSSKWYFDALPGWIDAWNKKHSLANTHEITWKTAYPLKHKAYGFDHIRNYEFAGFANSMIGSPIKIDHPQKTTGSTEHQEKNNPFEMYLKTPRAAQDLVSIAKACISKNVTQSSDNMLLWISFSNLDLVGHYYGPDSMECIDTIYHLDQQIKELMDFARSHVGAKKCLFALTADHGICPIPELSHKRGNTLACRIMAPKLIKDLNAHIKEKHQVDDFIKKFEPNFFLTNKELIATLTTELTKEILADVKAYLLKQKGIAKVWTLEELEAAPFAEHQIEHFYKNQLYPNRSGDIFIMPRAHCLITNYEKGTSHSSPYEYDTHVPLVLYQKGYLERKNIEHKVFITQLVPTLAKILNVNKPSGAVTALLPGIN